LILNFLGPNMSDYYGSANHASNAGTTSSSSFGGAVNLDADKIFVGGLSWQTTEDSLRYHFEQYGPVVSVEVMKDRVTGDPRGFAFVVFSKEETVDLVMQEVRHEINHKVVDVKRAQARGIAPPSIHESRRPDTVPHVTPKHTASLPPPPVSHNVSAHMAEPSPEMLQNKIFIGGLPPHVDKEELKRIFSQFGAVADSIIMMDQAQQRSRGFGFVTYENGTGGAHKALAAQPVNVHGRLAEVKLATPKGEQAPRNNKPIAMGLRAGISGSSSGEFAGLAASYGRNGWRAGYGTRAFGAAGWDIPDWDRGIEPDHSGFSFDMIQDGPAKKRAKH
jgi:RNA-binding protein Musashi